MHNVDRVTKTVRDALHAFPQLDHAGAARVVVALFGVTIVGSTLPIDQTTSRTARAGHGARF